MKFKDLLEFTCKEITDMTLDFLRENIIEGLAHKDYKTIVMFCLADEGVLLLHTFCKTDKKDSAKGLKAAYRMLDIAGKSKAEVVL